MKDKQELKVTTNGAPDWDNIPKDIAEAFICVLESKLSALLENGAFEAAPESEYNDNKNGRNSNEIQ